MTRVIDARNVGYTYPDGTVALEGVDVAVESGERVAIVGPNGAGKSTLLLLLGGLLEPTTGQVRYFEETTDPEAVRDRLGVVLQDPEAYLFNTTVEADLSYGPAQLGRSEAERERRVAALADRFDLTHLLEKPPFRLSGGEQRRAAIASGLSTDPSVLLLDEPFSNVDARHRQQLREVLAERGASGMTSVIATSNMDLVPYVADRVYLVDRSSVARSGSMRSVVTDVDTLEDCGLSPPTVVKLFRELDVAVPPVTVEEAATWVSNRLEE